MPNGNSILHSLYLSHLRSFAHKWKNVLFSFASFVNIRIASPCFHFRTVRKYDRTVWGIFRFWSQESDEDQRFCRFDPRAWRNQWSNRLSSHNVEFLLFLPQHFPWSISTWHLTSPISTVFGPAKRALCSVGKKVCHSCSLIEWSLTLLNSIMIINKWWKVSMTLWDHNPATKNIGAILAKGNFCLINSRESMMLSARSVPMTSAKYICARIGLINLNHIKNLLSQIQGEFPNWPVR